MESTKLGGYLPGLSFLDTAQGMAPIVNKLPPNLQEKWMSQWSQYNLQFQVPFPPFTFFTEFVCREAYMRNDSSVRLQCAVSWRIFERCAANRSQQQFIGSPAAIQAWANSHLCRHRTNVPQFCCQRRS